ncbi:MAG: carbohydrate-binding family 9-like protein [Melioribacteraceae bacterium]
MKIIFLIGVLLFLIQCSANFENEYEIESMYASVAPIIDGNLNENIWKIVTPIVLKENHSGNDVSDPELRTEVKTCYDESTIYLVFICNDPDIWSSSTARDEYLWKEEAIEVFIDVDKVPENYVEIEVSPANILFDSYIVDPEIIDVAETARFDLQGIRTGVKINGTINERDDRDKNWTVEIAIPFKDLNTENNPRVTSKTEIKINFFRLDKNRGMNFGSYAWSPTGARFHKPSVFGKVIFK